MRLENAVAADVLERILSAYGFTMQKELSDKLGIAKSNVASWLQRGQVPGNVLVQCALDTGADVQWLVTGVFANANMRTSSQSPGHSLLNGKSLIKEMLESGGKPVLQRIMEAYGFKTQKELSEYLGISTGTISTWIRREFFPADVVIACALDTDAALEWLAIGDNLPRNVDKKSQSNLMVNSKILVAGRLENNGVFSVDNTLIPEGIDQSKLEYIRSGKLAWLIDAGEAEISNGIWLLDIDGIYDIYTVKRFPNSKLKISGRDVNFECSAKDVNPKGIVVVVFNTLV